MAKNTDEKLNIQEAIKAFSKDDISTAGINLFSVLGYDTSLQAPLDNKTYSEFKENYIDSSPAADRFSEEKALTEQWESIDILFQLTDDSFSGTKSLFEESVNPTDIQSYLCFAIELKGNEYSKTQIAGITREVNKLFSIPIIIIFKYGECITLSIINRRVNKRDSERDVLEKVTLIKDIFFEKPHSAHIEILFDMSFAQLKAEYTIYNFETLHKAWSEVLDTQILNKRFYAELSNWYLWAIKTVVYPGADVKADKNYLFVFPDRLIEHNAKNLIRLLTRLLFVWFIKEKELIPEELFDENIIKDIITLFEPEKYYLFNTDESVESKSIYYKAILQNLFFASLNAEQGKRAFRIDGQNQNATSLMRYKRYHKNPEDFVKLIESKVPFMNGGLFECLDHQDDVLKGKNGGALINYEDGFSDRKDNELFVPDYIFFGKDVKVDLSSEYDDRRKKDVTVNGIINILQKYKFTIAENTPVEEDIALDPELLGRVFENLLASYNPETKTNARKQTGSFYTPRPIVEYMVDESLKAYLKTKIASATLSNHNDEDRSLSAVEGNEIDKKLDNLIAYNESEPEFTEEERFQILKYIDECKILDPACGSGAFPMGILQKMVYVIHKLDPQNDNWKQIQIQKISNDTMLTPKEKNELQKELLTVFDDNELDYARKLYLIENCIHGIDIQPIATQISRLRFFISLIVDQKVDGNKANFGVRPLPNLENRFVTANCLIGLNEDTRTLFDKNIELLMERLQKVRHKLFNAKSPKYKFELRQEDKVIRTELEAELVKNGFGKENAKLLSTWDPYDKNKSAEFFDTEWMFGIKDGFDIVIGNPPYISAPMQIANPKLAEQRQKLVDSKNYKSLYQKWDLYIPFIELGTKLNSKNGITAMIVPFPLTNQLYAKSLRKILVEENNMYELVDLNGTKIFDNATVSNCIPFVRKGDRTQKTWISNIFENKEIQRVFEQNISDLIQDEKSLVWNVTQEKRETNRHADMHVLGDYCYISKGMVLNSHEDSYDEKFKKADLISEIQDDIHCRKFLEGKDCGKYVAKKIRYLEYNTERVPDKCSRPTFRELYTIPKLMFNRLGELQVFFDENGDFTTSDAMFVCLKWDSLSKVENKSIASSIKKFSTMNRDDMETLSESVDLRYLLGIMNSRYASVLLTNLRGGDYHIYPEHIRNIPIPFASKEQQKPIIDLVDKILAAKRADNTADTSAMEAEIDRLVYSLYGLTEEEIKIVEGRWEIVMSSATKDFIRRF